MWESCCCHLSSVRWHRRRRNTFLSPHSLQSVAGGRPSTVVMRTGELALPLTSSRVRESGPFTSPQKQGRAAQGSRVLGKLAWGYECRIAGPATCLHCSVIGRGQMVLFSSLLPPIASRKAGPEVISIGELALPLTYCSTQERSPGLVLGLQGSWPKAVSTGELVLHLV